MVPTTKTMISPFPNTKINHIKVEVPMCTKKEVPTNIDKHGNYYE